MRRLLQGFAEFRRNGYPERKSLFKNLAQGQTPLAMFITCSDSRISPNLITNTEPGDLFVMRNAGNLVPPHSAGRGEAATIEYAVKVLQIKDIVVCGHTQCGAMAALLDPHSCDGLPAVKTWLQGGRAMVERIREQQPDISDERVLDLIVHENVIAQLGVLQSHPAVSDAVAEGALQLHGWVFSIASGQVDVLDQQQLAFIPAAQMLHAV